MGVDKYKTDKMPVFKKPKARRSSKVVDDWEGETGGHLVCPYENKSPHKGVSTSNEKIRHVSSPFPSERGSEPMCNQDPTVQGIEFDPELLKKFKEVRAQKEGRTIEETHLLIKKRIEELRERIKQFEICIEYHEQVNRLRVPCGNKVQIACNHKGDLVDYSPPKIPCIQASPISYKGNCTNIGDVLINCNHESLVYLRFLEQEINKFLTELAKIRPNRLQYLIECCRKLNRLIILIDSKKYPQEEFADFRSLASRLNGLANRKIRIYRRDEKRYGARQIHFKCGGEEIVAHEWDYIGKYYNYKAAKNLLEKVVLVESYCEKLFHNLLKLFRVHPAFDKDSYHYFGGYVEEPIHMSLSINSSVTFVVCSGQCQRNNVVELVDIPGGSDSQTVNKICLEARAKIQQKIQELDQLAERLAISEAKRHKQ